MLNVNTLPNRKDEELMFDECYSQLRFRSKRTEEGRQKYFKTKCVSSQNKREKEEGATVAASHLPFPAGSLIRPDRQRSSMDVSKTVGNSINYRKCPTNETPAFSDSN